MKVNMNMDGRESRDHAENKAVLFCSVKKNKRFREGNSLSIVLLELKSDLRMITRKLPLIVDMKETSIKRFPWATVLSLQKDVDISCGTIVPFSNDSTDTCSNTPRIFHAEMDVLLMVPDEVINSGYMFKSLRQGRTHHRIINLVEFLDKCSLVTESGNLLVSPSARWILDSIEASSQRRPLVTRALFSKPLMFEGVLSSSTTRDAKTSQLLTSSSANSNPLSVSSESLVTSWRKVGSEAKTSREFLLSCSSTKSTSSYCSTSSSGFMTSGTLRCFWKKNVPCFLFFSGDSDVYMASSMKVKSSVHKGLDYIYLFHSWNGSLNDLKNEADIIGKMKVSSSLLLNSDLSKSMETEFVLFSTNYEHIRRQKSSNIKTTNRMSIKGAKCFRLPSSRHKFGESSSQFKDIWQTFSSDMRVIENVSQVDRLLDDFLPINELAAIVVKDHGYDSAIGAIPSGWGLKFLEQGSMVQDCKQINTGVECNSSKTVEALIPAGFHGGSSGITGGPSSLVERWMSNGHCDCGGWDIGCPLKVLLNDANFSECSPESMPEDHYKSLQLVVQGAKQGEPAFKLLNLTEDMYAVYFQPTISALQSFSIAVAMIHSQTPHLYPKL